MKTPTVIKARALEHPRRRGRYAAALLCLGATSVLAACGSSGSTKATSSGSSTASSSSGSLSAGMKYYKGKTITFIAPDKPGGGFDNWARTVAPWMGKYLHATVNIQNIPAGNTIVGQNTLASSKPNGLTIGWLNLVEDVSDKAAGVAGVTFNPAKLALIGATDPIPVVVITKPSSPYQSFASVVKSTTPVTALTQTKGSTALIEKVILAGFGVKTKYIAGYESSASLKAGFVRGDGVLSVDNISAFGPLISAKSATPVLLTSSVPSTSSIASDFSGVPTLSQFEQTHPLSGQAGNALKAALALYTYNTTLAAAAGTPADEVAALRAAMQWALQQPGAQQQALKLQLNPGYESPTAALSAINTAFGAAAELKPYVPGA